jgi:hypothetical protein
MEYKIGDIVESGLVACNKCKNKRISDNYFYDGECLASPKVRFNFDTGEKYISDYYDCADINMKGKCDRYQEGEPTNIDPPKTWWQKLLFS